MGKLGISPDRMMALRRVAAGRVTYYGTRHWDGDREIVKSEARTYGEVLAARWTRRVGWTGERAPVEVRYVVELTELGRAIVDANTWERS